MDDRLLPVFLVFVFLPSLPFLTVMLYVLTGFCGYGLIGVEEIRDKLNPFVLISSEVMDSGKRQHQYVFSLICLNEFCSLKVETISCDRSIG